MDVTFYSTDQNTKKHMPLSIAEEKFASNTEGVDDVKEKEQIKKPAKREGDVVVKKKKEQSKKVEDSDESKNKNEKNKEIDKNKNKSRKKTKEKNNERKTETVQKISNKSSVPNEVGTSPNLKSESPLNGSGSLYMEASLDTNNFKYPYYISQVRRKIATQWRWAESCGNLRVLIYFKINRDGSVSNISVKESSGNEDYNRNALDTIRRVSPFAELPEGYEGDSLGVFFEFKY
ncbi:MAG: TonB family protein [Endomicrobium sp.]|jgi:TonB family protein|nr:TonB family protein [Endomicrobium sp.]